MMRHIHVLGPRWARCTLVSSLVGLACGTVGPGSADPEPSTGTASEDTEGEGATDSVGATDGATDGVDGHTDGDDDCSEAAECPVAAPGTCPLDLVGTELGSDRILGVTCSEHCAGPRTSLELYDPVTAQGVVVATTEHEIIPQALAVAADGSVVVAGVRQPLWWEPAVASTLHHVAADGAILWTAQFEDVWFHELVVRGDEILGFGEQAVAAFALADGSPTWTLPLGLIPLELAAASDGTLYVSAWDGIAPFEGRHVLAFDPALALLWDVDDVTVPDQERRLDGMIVDETGGVIVAAQVTMLSDANEVIELRKLDAAGHEVWTAIVDAGLARSESNDERLYDVVARPGGGAIAVGRAADPRLGRPLAVAFDADGNELWSELGEPDSSARLEHVVYVGDQGYAMGCDQAEWMVPLQP